MAQTQIKEVSWWHEAIIDWMLANPEKKLRDCAEHFNVTVSWLSVIKRSDCFRALWEERRAGYSHHVEQTLTDKLTTLSELSLDAQIEKIEVMGPLMDLDDLRKVGKDAIAALGYGKTPSVQINNNGEGNVNLIGVDSDTLAAARDRISARNQLLAEENANVVALPAPQELSPSDGRSSD